MTSRFSSLYPPVWIPISLDLAMTAPDRSNSSDSVPSTRLHVGIDVSKASLEVALIGSEEDASASHTVPNTEDGFGQLLNWLEKQTDVGLEETREPVHVCLEASGDYQRPAARFLYETLFVRARADCLDRQPAAHERLR
jgi:hypothetical protein